jgi:hypothetical protein
VNVSGSGTLTVNKAATTIASGYGFQFNSAALVIGPAGLAYEGATDTLYVAAEVDNAIFKVINASTRTTAANKGTVFFSGTPLRGPVGLTLAPNGHVIASNSDAVNGDPTNPSEIVEFTHDGNFLREYDVNEAQGAAFGVAFGAPSSSGTANFVPFVAVNDASNGCVGANAADSVSPATCMKVKIGCHTFRATGITAYLEAGGTLENAQAMAARKPRARRSSMTAREMRSRSTRSSGLRFIGKINAWHREPAVKPAHDVCFRTLAPQRRKHVMRTTVQAMGPQFPVSAGTLILGASRRDHNLALHLGMQAAKIAVGSWLGEGERETVTSIESLGMELALGRDDGMGNVIAIAEDNCRPGFHAEFLWGESEIVDVHLHVLRAGRQ